MTALLHRGVDLPPELADVQDPRGQSADGPDVHHATRAEREGAIGDVTHRHGLDDVARAWSPDADGRPS